MKKILTAAVFTALSCASMLASATIITFDSLEQAGSSFQYLSSYNENGFNLSAGSLGSAQQGNTGWYFGSASLFNDHGSAVTTLTKIGGGTFNFDSIDLAPVSTVYGSGATVSFVGNVNGGGTVNASYTLNSTFSFQTFALTGFNNLDSVTWIQSANYHQFDNLVLDQSSRVPEPGSLALVGLALAAFAVARRKAGQA
jgi:hypothetical protein